MNSCAAFVARSLLLSLVAVPAGPASASDRQAALLCPASAPDAFCSALSRAVGAQRPDAEATAKTVFPAELLVRFVSRRVSDDSLAGHLVWVMPDGSTGAGPTLELSVMDAALTPEALSAFAEQLVSFSKLPL